MHFEAPCKRLLGTLRFPTHLFVFGDYQDKLSSALRLCCFFLLKLYIWMLHNIPELL
uniref:Uncharacterized protein n=1 Tax=Rhizophora mucronata TaxID=61149 RepID=A0A2P2NJ25_RHIMU